MMKHKSSDYGSIKSKFLQDKPFLETAEEPALTVTEPETVRASGSSILSGKSIGLRNEPEAITLTLAPTFHFHAFSYAFATELYHRPNTLRFFRFI